MLIWLHAIAIALTAILGALSTRLSLLLFVPLIFGFLLFAFRYPDVMPAISAVIFVCVAFSGWVLRMLLEDLISVFAKLGLRRFTHLMLWSSILTLPVVVLVWIALDFGQARTNAALYGCGRFEGAFDTPAPDAVVKGHEEGGEAYLLSRVVSEREAPSQIFDPVASRFCVPPLIQYDLEKSMVASVSSYAGNTRQLLRGRVEAAVDGIESSGLSGTEATTRVLFGVSPCDGILPQTLESCPIVPPSKCPFYRWPFKIGECASREVKRTVQFAIIRAYEGQVSSFRATWEAGQTKLYANSQDGRTAVTDATNSFIDSHLGSLEQSAVSSVNRSFTAWRFLSWTLFIWTLVLVFKVFFYVFARLAFAPNGGGIFLTLEPKGCMLRAKPEFRSLSNNFTVRRPLGSDAWYVSRGGVVSWDRPEPISFLPRPGSLLFARIFTGKFFWMAYRPSDTMSEISGNHPNTFPVAEVRLPLGSRVVIDLARLEGFTEGIRMRTIFSARLSAFLQRRMLFTEISGPGSILISGREGTIWALGRNGAPQAVEAQAIIVLDRYGSFGCRSGTDPASLMMNAPTIYPEPGNGALLVASANPQGTRPSFRWFRHVLFFAFV